MSSQRIKRPCPYCNKMNSKLSKHLVVQHLNEPKVQDALALPKTLRHRAFALLKKEGILRANRQVMKNKSIRNKELYLIRERRQSKAGIAMCSLCQGFFSKRYIARHYKNCPYAEYAETTTVSVSLTSVKEESKDFREKVLSKLDEDDVGNLCKTDPIIQMLGKHSFEKLVNKKRGTGIREMRLKYSKIVMDMRKLGNLYFEFKERLKNDNKITSSCEDMLNTEYFPYLSEAIKQVSKKEEKSELGLNYTTRHLLNMLRVVCKKQRGNLLWEGREHKVEDLDKFLSALIFFWQDVFQKTESSDTKSQALSDDSNVMFLKNFDLKNCSDFGGDEFEEKEVSTSGASVPEVFLSGCRTNVPILGSGKHVSDVSISDLRTDVSDISMSDVETSMSCQQDDVKLDPDARGSCSSCIVKAKHLNAVDVGFSCVYCDYAAALRHQVRLHCYDKHANFPACLIQFQRDEYKFCEDVRMKHVVSYSSDDKNSQSVDVCSSELKLKDINKDAKLQDSGKENREIIKTIQKEKEDCNSNKKDNVSESATEQFLAPLINDEKSSKFMFENPLRTLHNHLQACRIQLQDTFQVDLDKFDAHLFQNGVRTLNLEVLTQQQFSKFIERFGNKLQPA